MRFLKILFLSVSILSIMSCDKDNEGSLTLRFIAQSDGNPVEMFKTENSVNVHPLQFTHLSMLLSDFKLLGNGDEQFLKEVDLVDLSFDDLNSATEGFTIHIDQIPAKTYDGITFGIGVPPSQNAKVPADFPSSNPLSRTGYYWEAWDSYIFMKIEGRIDTDSSGDFETNFAFHTGSNELYSILESQFPISITEGGDTEITIVFDYAELLEGIDIATNPQNHNPADSIQIGRIVNNLQNAITLFP